MPITTKYSIDSGLKDLVLVSFCIFATLVLIFSHPKSGNAQSCQGSTGDNIFTDGDFGSGVANILSTDPGLNASYTYTISPPPDDGFYTITNNTSLEFWPGLWPTWIGIGDNSSDPNGYMMIVNASFEPDIFFERLVEGICENTEYEFSADLINLIVPGVQNHIKPNVTFLINGIEFFNTGDIEQTNSWTTFASSFSSAPGDSQVLLTIRNNAPGGIGNDIGLDNISFRPCGPLAMAQVVGSDVVCPDNPFAEVIAVIDDTSGSFSSIQWQISVDNGGSWANLQGENGPSTRHSISQPGFYNYRFLLANSSDNLGNLNCRILSNEVSVEVVAEMFEIFDTLCPGLEYTFGQSNLTASGTYIDTYSSSKGCDSIVTLHLTFLQSNNLQAELITESVSCPGFNDGSIEIAAIQGASFPVSVFVDDMPSPMLIDSLSAGLYNVCIVDNFGCTLSETARIVEPSDIELEAGPDRNIRLGEVIETQALINSNSVNISWEPTLEFDCPTCLNTTLRPIQSGYYVITAFDRGCMKSDSFYITLDRRKNVFVSNVFAPDSASPNTHVFVQSFQESVLNISSFKIFDRWGALLFEAQDIAPDEPSLGWNGTFNEQDLPTGVYVYVCQIDFIDGESETFAGSVTLLR